MLNNRRLSVLFLLALLQLSISALSLRGADAAAEDAGDVDEPPPQGYEERYFPISDLCGELKDLSRFCDMSDAAGTIVDPFAEREPGRLTGEQIIQIIKAAAAPDTWGKHSPARISEGDGSIIALQKPEVLDEIAKVVAWLREGVAAPYRGTVVAVKLKPETVAQLAQNPAPLGSAEMLKLMDDAGADASPQIVDVTGYEGQTVTASGQERRNYIRDYDVAGAVYDPVMQQAVAGLRLKLTGFRTPDCKSIRLDFQAELDRNLSMETAHISSSLAGVQESPPAPPPPDEKQKQQVVVEEHAPMAHMNQKPQNLKLELPSRTSATLHSSIMVSPGKYVFAGTMDLGLASREGTPELLAFFARATIGTEGVPTLMGVSGLKAGESFRLYPTQAMTRTVRDFPATNSSGIPMDFQGGAAPPNPYAPVPASEAPALRKAKALFQEQVRKDKLVEPVGPVIFTRLTDPDHQKLASALMSDYLRRYSPLRAHALAVSMPVEKARKIILEGGNTFEYAAILEMANGADSKILMNQAFGVMNRQRTSVVAGIRSNVIWGYDINGDAYDPSIRTVLDRGYVLDLRPTRVGDGKSLDLLLHLQVVPQQNNHNHTSLESFSINAGAQLNVVVTGNFDVDLPQTQLIDMHQQFNIPLGKYVLAGAAGMPAEGAAGKDQKRQTLLFIRMDAAQ
jgi:hypothetical protein